MTDKPATQQTGLEIEKTKISLQLQKAGQNYQNALNELGQLHFTRETIESDQSKLKQYRAVLTKLNAVENPYTKDWQNFNAALKSLVDPYKKLLDEKAKSCATLAAQIEKEKKDAAEKAAKAVRIKDAINSFILTKANDIAAADTYEKLESIRRLIDLEKTRKNIYDDQLGILTERCTELNALIASQKAAIKLRQELDALTAEAATDEEILSLYGQKEVVDQDIADRAIDVQETALNAASRQSEAITPEVVLPTVKARRTTWKYELVDVDKAFQKCKGMLDIALNSEKAKERLNELKGTGELDNEEEYVESGIRYYQEKLY